MWLTEPDRAPLLTFPTEIACQKHLESLKTRPSSNVSAEQKVLFCCRYDLHPAGATKTKAALEGVPLS